MNRLALVALVAALVAAITPSLGLAKGPIEATLEGPGLDEPIVIGGEGPNALAPEAPLMRIAESAGFFPAAFGAASWNDGDPTTRDTNPMLSRRPKGTLGPRYVITYRVPGPTSEDVLRQDLYPYARPFPVSYMPPGQPFFDWRETAGGWYVSRPALKETLVAAGLPRSVPQPPPVGSSFPWTLVVAAAGLGAFLAVGVGAALLRRRPHPA